MSALYQHQSDGAAVLGAHARRYLGDTPGLGKTRTLLATVKRNGTNRRVLVVCPAIVRSHWLSEAQVIDVDIIVKSYDEITRGGVGLMKQLVPLVDTLILDEAHYLKHRTSQRTKMLLGKDGYARRIQTVYLASGTPMPRNPAEMFPVLAALFPEALLKRGINTYDQFVARYCSTRGSYVRGAWREKIVGVRQEALAELQDMLREVMLRRTLDDVGLDVPRIQWQIMRLDADHASTREVLAHNWPNEDELHKALTCGQLADIMLDPHVSRMRRRLGELKAPLVVEMVKAELEADPKLQLAIFAHHRSVLEALYQGLFQYGASYIDGDTPPDYRPDEIRDFQRGVTRVFIGQNIACSTGMDGLQHATNRAILVEPDWSADVNYQLGHRVARIGSTQDRAIVQMIALAGTLDEAIVAQNRRETEMVEAALSRKEAA